MSLDVVRRTRAYADRALALDSTLSEPHTALAFAFAQHFAIDDAEREFKRAIALDSTSATAYHLYGFMLLGLGRWADALPLYEKAGRLDPLSGPIAQAQSQAFAIAQRWDDGLAVGQRIIPIDSIYGSRILANVYLRRQQWPEAQARLMVARNLTEAMRDMVRVLVGLGRRHEADSVRAVLEEHTKNGGRYADVAVAYAAFGDTTHTLDWLGRAIDRYDGGLLAAQIPTRPEFEFLRNDPRYKALMARIGVKPQ
jgi:tetratricopeptide (TPR) repeat protein